MRAVRYHEFGDPSVLRVEDVEKQAPSNGELLVEIRAASINPVDAKRRRGSSNPLPQITGSDFAGVVAEVGDDVSEYSVGDRVFGTGLHTERFHQGSAAEFVTVPVDIIAPLPEGVSFETGAGAALVGVTAWRGLLDHASLDPANTCLIHGGSGGVGHVAVQLAAEVGATVISTAGTQSHRDIVRELGADVVFDYGRGDLTEAVRDQAPAGVDVVFDHRVHEYFQLDVDVAAFGGSVVIYGGGSATIADSAVARGKELTVSTMSMSNLAVSGELSQMTTVLRKVARLLERDALTIEVARTYNLDGVGETHRAVMEDSFVGKLMIKP
ncbi:quinone oxidoreductase family protein [Halegenticoccus tardaugens]|uniref:quinone oxidoreductase family protein n=1 Tax=Halegenticoccus tardaugens TaxID=2071624 RepID=UPI00100A5957|nr:NADPH:quinone reductase [Halegenticoccus tardaugens]